MTLCDHGVLYTAHIDKRRSESISRYPFAFRLCGSRNGEEMQHGKGHGGNEYRGWGVKVLFLSLLGVFDGVFAFLQLGDVQLGLGTVQSFEPHFVIVDGGDDGAARQIHTHTHTHKCYHI